MCMYQQNNFSGQLRKEGRYNMCALYASFSVFFFFKWKEINTHVFIYIDGLWKVLRKTEFF